MTRILSYSFLLVLALGFFASLGVQAQSSEEPFLPVWRLLTNKEKQHFVAGYIRGWQDAAKVTDIAIDYVKENPKDAVEGLQKLKALYDLSAISPDSLTRQIDAFYADPTHASAGLSVAVTSAKRQLK